LLLFELCDALVSIFQSVFNVELSEELYNKLEKVFKQRLVFEILELMVVDEVFEFCKAQVIEFKVPSVV
jgi:hypothetical protein